MTPNPTPAAASEAAHTNIPASAEETGCMANAVPYQPHDPLGELAERFQLLLDWSLEARAMIEGESPSLVEGDHNWIKFTEAIESAKTFLTPTTLAALREQQREASDCRQIITTYCEENAALESALTAAQSDALDWRTKFDAKCEEAEAAQQECARLTKENAALHAPASRDFTPAEIIRIASELHLCTDEVRRQPTFGKIEAEVKRLSSRCEELIRERDWAKHLSRRITNQREELSQLNAEYTKVLSALSGTENLRVKAEAQRDALRVRVAELEAGNR